MKTSNWYKIIMGASLCVVLSACSWYAEVGHNQPDGNYIKIGVKGTIGTQSQLFTEGLGSIEIDLAALNTTVTSNSGTFLLTLTQNDQAIAAKSFQYIVVENIVTAEDPEAVQSWANGYPSANGADVSLPSVRTIDGSGPTSSLTATLKYDDEAEASATASWTPTPCSRSPSPERCAPN